MIKVLNVPSLYSALYSTIDFCCERSMEEIEIVVPDKLSLFMEKFLFEKMNISASFNIKVSTLNRLAKKTCVVDKNLQISKSGCILLIHRILNENLDKLEVLKSKAYSFSYAEEIYQTIGQLKASKISFEEMKRFSSTDERLCSKIKDLALVYEQYETLKAGLIDAADLFLMSTLTVTKGKENKKLIFVGFDDFTAIEYAIIERLSTVCEVNVFNYFSSESNRYIYNTEVISQLKNIAYINQLPFEIIDCNTYGTELKKFLQSNVYSVVNKKFILNKEPLKIYSGNSLKDEIEFVARDIRSQIMEGKSFGEFGVAVYDLANNINKIKEIFVKYELNYYLDSEISLSNSVLYKFYSNLLKYNLDGYSLVNLIDLINSPFLSIEKEDKRELIQKLISVNFRGKITDNLNLDIDDELKQKFVQFMNPITIDKNVEVVDLITLLKSFETVYNFDEILNFLANKNVENKILLTKSKQVIYELFDDIVRFYPNAKVEEFFDIYSHISNTIKINNLPLSLDCVKVVDANNTLEIFDNFYMVGVTHDKAPNLKYDCGIILDNEIEKLNFAHKLSPTISHINKLSKLRLFNSLMLFENSLTLTYSNNASDVVKQLLNKIQIETKNEICDLVAITNFKHSKYNALSKWDYIEARYLNNKNIEKNIENTEKIIKNKEFINISKENLNIYDDFNIISSTTLENYFKCPFYAFLTNILKIKPRLETEILSFDIGNVLHEIMYKYYKFKKQVGDIYSFCKTEVFKCVEREERLKLNVDSPILTNLIDEAVRVINAVDYIDKNSSFIPQHFELEFKGENALKLKNISIIGKVDRVDVLNDMFRIVDYKSGKADATLKELYYGNKLQLFLYSCAMENVLRKRAVGTFYLPLHNAYTKELTNTYSLKGFYLAEDFVVKSFDKRLEPGIKSDIVNVKLNKSNEISKMGGYKELDINSLNDLKEYAKKVSENAVDEIKSGYIAPTPNDISKPCEYCPYVHVCLKNANNIDYRKSKKVNLDSFKEVEDESV